MLIKLEKFRPWMTNIVIIITLVILIVACSSAFTISDRRTDILLTEPFLQLPTEKSIRVVWFTEFPGKQNIVFYGEGLKRSVTATTTKLSRTQEDQNSQVGNQTKDGQVYKKPTSRNIWRHEGIIDGLNSGLRIPYQVKSTREDGKIINSDSYTLSPTPSSGTPLKILLTSDYQLKPMVSANLQKVAETIGKVDAIFFAGDAVNISDRASEWFDDNRGGAFFPSLQGRANYELGIMDNGKTTYKGGKLIQYAPIFTTIGNHEVMGRVSKDKSLNEQYEDTKPRFYAEKKYQELNQSNLRQNWIKDNSFNTDTYEEIFTLPQSQEGKEKYYAVSFGDIRLVVLYAANMWRSPALDNSSKGKYRERNEDFNKPENWGYGQHIYEPISKGSTQYKWLEKELNSPEFEKPKYKIVMLHNPPHSLGDNVVPAFTNPVQIIQRDKASNIQAIRYEYPKDADYLIRDVIPLLEKAKVQLVFYGHSHIWNRFISKSKMHFLESSNVGNSYGAFIKDKQRPTPSNYKESYTKAGDANGLQPIIPTIAPLTAASDGQPLPYIALNDITVFSIFDTKTGIVSSYRFDGRNPSSTVVKFDEFKL
jgi:Calcineurin-like phosphoesterase